MITAWDVYWVMQLDRIVSVSHFVAVFGVTLGLFGTAIRSLAAQFKDKDGDSAIVYGVLWLAPYIFVFGLTGWATYTLLPSSKTAAAMIILPAITSDEAAEAIKPEARELYELAKKAVANLAEKPAVEKDAEK